MRRWFGNDCPRNTVIGPTLVGPGIHCALVVGRGGDRFRGVDCRTPIGTGELRATPLLPLVSWVGETETRVRRELSYCADGLDALLSGLALRGE